MSDASTHAEEHRSGRRLGARGAEAMSHHHRWIERVTNRIGQPLTFYLIVAFVVLWIAPNVIASQTVKAVIRRRSTGSKNRLAQRFAGGDPHPHDGQSYRANRYRPRQTRLADHLSTMAHRKADPMSISPPESPQVPTHNDPEVQHPPAPHLPSSAPSTYPSHPPQRR